MIVTTLAVTVELARTVMEATLLAFPLTVTTEIAVAVEIAAIALAVSALMIVVVEAAGLVAVGLAAIATRLESLCRRDRPACPSRRTCGCRRTCRAIRAVLLPCCSLYSLYSLKMVFVCSLLTFVCAARDRLTRFRRRRGPSCRDESMRNGHAGSHFRSKPALRL